MAVESVRAIIISVGGDPQPVIGAINRYHPESLCFFVPEDHQRSVDEEIIPKMERPPRQWDQITTPDAHDLKKCCQVLSEYLPGMMGRWEVDPSQVVVDCAEGTKAMSAALLACAVDFASGFVAAGADAGPQNLWDELAVNERKIAGGRFNRARYREAADDFTAIQKKVGGGAKPLYKALTDLSMGYAYWDAFDYRQAWNRLQEAKKALEMATLFGGPPGLKTTVTELKQNLLLLEKMALGPQDIKQELFLDLVSNARRRVEFDGNVEEATSRILRALEVMAQVRLFEKGIRTSAVDPEKLPQSVKSEFAERYTSEIDGKIKIGLTASYRLLKLLGDGLGNRFESHWISLKASLEAREQSILGHGSVTMKRERYQQIYDVVLKISQMRDDQFPRFPRLEL